MFSCLPLPFQGQSKPRSTISLAPNHQLHCDEAYCNVHISHEAVHPALSGGCHTDAPHDEFPRGVVEVDYVHRSVVGRGHGQQGLGGVETKLRCGPSVELFFPQRCHVNVVRGRLGNSNDSVGGNEEVPYSLSDFQWVAVVSLPI